MPRFRPERATFQRARGGSTRPDPMNAISGRIRRFRDRRTRGAVRGSMLHDGKARQTQTGKGMLQRAIAGSTRQLPYSATVIARDP